MARVHPEIYFFGAGVAEGRAEMRNLLGGKGANLAEMASLKLPVPPGFTISTQVCNYFYDHGHKYPKGLTEGVEKSVARVEKALGRKFGDREKSAAVLGPLGRARLDARHDGHRAEPRADRRNRQWTRRKQRQRALRMGFVSALLPDVRRRRAQAEAGEQERSRSVRGNYRSKESRARRHQGHRPQDRGSEGTGRRVSRADSARVGRDIPQDPREQLWEAIGAVFGSWHNDRAITYRKINNIPGDWGTAVTVQSMVFGNLGDDCATGVAFTRDPVDRRERNLRRVPGQCAGRGRRRRNPHAASRSA